MAKKESKKKRAKADSDVNESMPENPETVEDGEAAANPSDGDNGETVDELKRQLEEAQGRYLRAKADSDNYRKRAQREFGEIRQSAKAATVDEFLTVFDHFQMAMEHAEQKPDIATLKEGMALILNEFQRAFENLGVKKVDATGEEFDPGEHHAVAEENSDGVPEGCVLRQWKPAYRLGERLIRPATVVVSKGPASQDSDETAVTEDNADLSESQ